MESDPDKTQASNAEETSKQLALPVTISETDEWTAIVNRLVDELNTEDLPDKVIEAAELMLAGYPTYKIARKLNVKPATVRRWLSTYPTLAAIVADGRKLLSKWRMAKLEQQFLTAVERSDEVLSIGLDGTYFDVFGEEQKANPKVLPVIAAQARYIIGLFASQKSDVTVTHEVGDSVLKAKEDALEYLAARLAEQQAGAAEEPIEAVVRVIDPKLDNCGPYLDEEGLPPFGEMGVLDRTDEGSLCHICGKRLLSLHNHLVNQHNTTPADYESLYLLPEGAVRMADETEDERP